MDRGHKQAFRIIAFAGPQQHLAARAGAKTLRSVQLIQAALGQGGATGRALVSSRTLDAQLPLRRETRMVPPHGRGQPL